MKKYKYLATELLVSLHKLVSGWLHCSVVGRCSQKLSEVSFGEKDVLIPFSPLSTLSSAQRRVISLDDQFSTSHIFASTHTLCCALYVCT